MMGAVDIGKLKRPSKQRTSFSAILRCSDFRGSRFTSQVFPALGRKRPTQGPCAWPNSSFKTMRWAVCEGREHGGHTDPLSLHCPPHAHETGISSDCHLQPRQHESTVWDNCLNTPNSSVVQRLHLSYLWQCVMYMAVSSHKALMSFSLDSTSCFLSSPMLRRAASAFTRIKSILELPSGSSARIFYEKKKDKWDWKHEENAHIIVAI